MTMRRVPGLFDAEALEQRQLRDGVRAGGSDRVTAFETTPCFAHASDLLGADGRDQDANVLHFFALRPDEHACAQIRARAGMLIEANQLCGVKLRGNYHITLTLPGPAKRLRTERDVALVRAGDKVRFAPVDVELDIALGFRSPHNSPFVLCASEASARTLKQLQTAVRAGLAHEGFQPPANKDFVPHVTLAYTGERTMEAQAVEPIRWRSDELFLIRSLQGQGRHEVMATWSLVGADSP